MADQVPRRDPAQIGIALVRMHSRSMLYVGVLVVLVGLVGLLLEGDPGGKLVFAAVLAAIGGLSIAGSAIVARVARRLEGGAAPTRDDA